jgi:Domain of unknown function (DUF4282)
VESQSFFSGLFDFSFKEYITPKVIRVIFVILIIFAGLGALFGLIFAFAGFGRNVAFGLLGVILVVLGFFLSVIFYRIFLEVVSALFRINDNIATLVQLSGGTPTVAPTDAVTSIPPPPPSTPPPTVPPESELPPSPLPPPDESPPAV